MAGTKPKIAVIGLYGASHFLGVEAFPKAGETVVAQKYLVEPGGKGFNQAVALARLGASVSFLTAVGEDAFGKRCQDYLEAEGITDYYLKECSGATASAAILYESQGTSRVVVYPGASLLFTAEDLKKASSHIAGSAFLLLQNELAPETLAAAIELAWELGVKVILNPAPAGGLTLELLEQVYLITPNEGEAAALTALPCETEAERLAWELHHRGAKRVVITLGERGVYVSEGNTGTLIEALEVSALDTTGAGDTFNGALTVALAKGYDLVTAARYGVVASGLAVTKPGVMTAIPSQEEVEELFTGNLG